MWFLAWVFREVEIRSLLWSCHQTKRGGLHFESQAHLSASWSHRNTSRTLVNIVQLLIKCTAKGQQCLGLSGFLSLYKVLFRSDLFLTHHFLNKLFSLSLQIGIIVILDRFRPQISTLCIGGSAFVINLTDEKLLGPQCNTKSTAEYEAEQMPNS